MYKKILRQWKQGHISQEKNRDVAQMCRGEIRKARAQLELNLARNVKYSKGSTDVLVRKGR